MIREFHSYFFLAGLLFFVSISIEAQISEYSDCSADSYQQSKFDSPLTQAEKVEQLDRAFFKRLSSVTKCEDKTSAKNSNNAQSSGVSSSDSVSMLSKNILSNGEKSLGVNATKSQEQAFDVNAVAPGGNYGSNGRAHKNLQQVDNTAVLVKQLKDRAEQELDPEIKSELLKQVESLE